MNFEEYKQGLKDVAQSNNEKKIAIYNASVARKCDFKVNVGELIANIENVNKIKDSNVGATITLSPGFDNNQLGKSLIGTLTVAITYNSPELSKSVVEEMAKFRVDHNTELANGTNLKQNTYIQSDYGRTSLRLMPDTNINDLIVKLDLNAEYMTYPVILKALLKCNIIENEQILTK
ncbi:MAG: hypothetical protein ACLRFE_03370 [Clostridia bacterium]